MKNASSLILILAVLGGSLATAEDGMYYQPYEYYDTDEYLEPDEYDPYGTYQDYGEWTDGQYNLDYEMAVPGYDYKGSMVYDEGDLYGDSESGRYPYTLDEYGERNGRNGYSPDDYYFDDEATDGDTYSYDEEPPDYARNGEVLGAGGKADHTYDYFTDDWYQYEDSFSDWYDSLDLTD